MLIHLKYNFYRLRCYCYYCYILPVRFTGTAPCTSGCICSSHIGFGNVCLNPPRSLCWFDHRSTSREEFVAPVHSCKCTIITACIISTLFKIFTSTAMLGISGIHFLLTLFMLTLCNQALGTSKHWIFTDHISYQLPFIGIIYLQISGHLIFSKFQQRSILVCWWSP